MPQLQSGRHMDSDTIHSTAVNTYFKPTDQPFSFNRLDEYVFRELLTWLPFKCIVKLNQTGNNALHRLIRVPGIVRRISIEQRELEKTLFCVAMYRRLQNYIDFGNITHLHVTYYEKYLFFEKGDPIFPLIASLPSLTNFVDRGHATDALRLVRSLPAQLSHLDIRYLSGEIEEVVKALPRDIEFFSMHKTFNNSASLLQLPRSLTHLELEAIKYRYGSNDGCVAVSCLPPNLAYLTLTQDTQLSDKTVQALPHSLQYLSLFWSRNITDAGIAALPRSLTYLELTNNNTITGDCFKHLPRCLTYLDASRARLVTDDVLAHLPPTLVSLHLADSSTGITDEGIGHLPHKLRALSLGWACLITNACIKSLPPLLHFLDISATDQLTEECLQDMPSNITQLIKPRHFYRTTHCPIDANQKRFNEHKKSHWPCLTWI